MTDLLMLAGLVAAFAVACFYIWFCDSVTGPS